MRNRALILCLFFCFLFLGNTILLNRSFAFDPLEDGNGNLHKIPGGVDEWEPVSKTVTEPEGDDLTPAQERYGTEEQKKDWEAEYRREHPGQTTIPEGEWERHVAKVNKLNAEVFYKIADEFRRNGEYEQAIADYTKAIELNSDNRYVYANRGYSYKMLQQYPEAIADFTRDIELNPKDVYAYMARGDSYIEMQEFSKAVADYSKAIELKPDYEEAVNKRDMALQKLAELGESKGDDLTPAQERYGTEGQKKDWEAEYRREHPGQTTIPEGEWERHVAKVNKLNAEVFYKIADELNGKREYDQAIDNFTKAIGLDSNYWQAYVARGISYSGMQQHPEAITNFDEANRLNPDWWTYHNRGISYFDMQQFPEAIADFDKAIELDPDFAFSYLERGNAYSAMQQFSQAIADYTKVIELDPKDVGAYIRRGTSYFEMQQYSQAIADYDKAIELNPDDELAIYNRELASQKLGLLGMNR